jgi:hypothetical protein
MMSGPQDAKDVEARQECLKSGEFGALHHKSRERPLRFNIYIRCVVTQ